MQLPFDQQLVLNAFRSGKNIFITGGAGTGKSYLLNQLKREQKLLEVTASTGIAAVNIAGTTIHSWSGIGFANLPVNKIVENLFTKKMSVVRKRIRQASVLAIDEISMISAGTFEILDHVFKAVRGSTKPMGGIQLVLVGDFLQLPPVNNFNAPAEKFCFESEAWNALELQTFVLKHNFRQNDLILNQVLNNLRFGVANSDDQKVLNTRIKVRDSDSRIRPTILTTHNHKVDTINSSELAKIGSDEMVYDACYTGNAEQFLRKNCLANEKLRLKIGAQVMMIKNTYQKNGVINGSLGIVRGFATRKPHHPIVEFSNKEILIIGEEEWVIEKFDAEKNQMVVEATVNQVPLVLAWAITIHKSQGMTLDKISCDLASVFSPAQIYVALSRARTLEGIFIESIDYSKVRADSRAVKFYETSGA